MDVTLPRSNILGDHSTFYCTFVYLLLSLLLSLILLHYTALFACREIVAEICPLLKKNRIIDDVTTLGFALLSLTLDELSA